MGENAVDVDIDVHLEAVGNTLLQPRTINLESVLNLLGTGNGANILTSEDGAFVLVQNGGRFRTNFFKDDTNGIALFYKFSNSSGSDMDVQVRYYPKAGGNPTNWVDYPTAIPAEGQLTFNAMDVAGVLVVAAPFDGFLDVRVKGAAQDLSGMVNASRNGANFNVPFFKLQDGQWMY